MKIRTISLKKTSTLLMVTCIAILFSSMAFAQECELITIRQEGSGDNMNIKLSPRNITLPVGTCTVWVNFAKDADIEISFQEGAKKCVEGSTSASGFGLTNLKTGESCYVSKDLAYGKTSSIFWTKPGEYIYTIKYTPKVPEGSLKKAEPHEIKGAFYIE
jgi:hypothetical protein